MKRLNFKLIWGIFMVLIFVGMFYLLVFTTYFSTMSLAFRIILGCIFLIYSIFRSYQLWNQGR